MLKVSYKIMDTYSSKKRKKPIRKGYCQVCGAKLSDANSIKRGIAQLLGCSVSTVNEALQGYQIELPESVEK